MLVWPLIPPPSSGLTGPPSGKTGDSSASDHSVGTDDQSAQLVHDYHIRTLTEHTTFIIPTLQIMTASRLSSSLMPSPSCRLIKTTHFQTWPKPYIKLQLPGGLFYSGFQPTVEYQEMSKHTSLQRRVPVGNSMETKSAARKRRPLSERSWCQDHREMTTTFCPGSSKLFWWGFSPDITDWTVICAANWSWRPNQPAPVVKKTKIQSMFFKDAPFIKLQEKMCGLSTLSWWPNSTAASRSWAALIL